jgi:hypothetical protein
LEATKKSLKNFMRSFSRGSAAGLDGFRSDYFVDFLSGSNDASISSFLVSYGKLVNLGLEGSLPSVMAPFFSAARLLPLRKSATDDLAVRPIAIGLIHRRLMGKVAVQAVSSIVNTTYLSPQQVGVGMANGGDGVVHALRHLTSSSDWSPSRFVLQIDFMNAFNCVDRNSLLQQVAERCPSIFRFVSFLYSHHSPLFLPGNPSVLSSQSGVQQGDPLGPLLFTLVLHPLVLKLQEELPGLDLNAWYMDDGTLVGEQSDLLTALETISEVGSTLGLRLNTDKSKVWSPLLLANYAGFVNQDLCTPAEEGIPVLGAPFSAHPGDLRKLFQKKLLSIREVIAQTGHLEKEQDRYVLLRYCTLYSRVNFLLRTVPP